MGNQPGRNFAPGDDRTTSATSGWAVRTFCSFGMDRALIQEYTGDMATITKCDGCIAKIAGQSVTVARSHPYIRYEFCEQCAKPNAAAAPLKRYKILDTSA